MKKIVRVVSVQKSVNNSGGGFYLSVVELDDGEEYSLASSAPPKIDDEVEAFFDDRYQKPKAVYPKGVH